MKIGAAVAQHGRSDACLKTAIPGAMQALDGETPDLAFVSITNHFEDESEAILRTVRERTGARALIGCSGEGVIGPNAEVEREPGLSVWLAHLPGVRVRGFYIHPNDLPAKDDETELRRLLRTPESDPPNFILLGEPFFTPYIVDLLDAMTRVFPNSPIMGGMASGAEAPQQSALMLDDDVFREGAVGVVLSGALRIDTVVSQGCRPVGKPYVITEADRNKIMQLGGKPALSVLNAVFEHAAPSEQKLMSHGVFIGRAIDEYRDTFDRGDFLIRNLLGADKDDQAIYMADVARVGTTVQFHVRDAASADEDLRSM
ncbi:MAG: FIST N-terminal domain-containing protein, partial [Phycisphaerae bacterium]